MKMSKTTLSRINGVRNYILFSAFVAVLLPLARAQFVGPSPTAQVEVKSHDPGSDVLQQLLHTPYPKVVLRADDTVSVKLYEVKDFDVVRRVTQSGTISLPLIGNIPAAGMSVDELQQSIDDKLIAKGMIYHPQAVVTEVSLPSAVITVSGDASKPGIFPAQGNLTLIDYLSMAGGLAKPAVMGDVEASPVVTLIRPSLPAPVTIQLGADPATSPYARIPVFAGDEIRIGKLGVVYAVGALHTQGAYALKPTSATTVLELIALAGGIGYEASADASSIVRTSGGTRVLIPLNVNKIINHQQADIPLQGDDILFIPTSKMKAAIKGGGAGVITALASAYIYKY